MARSASLFDQRLRVGFQTRSILRRAAEQRLDQLLLAEPEMTGYASVGETMQPAHRQLCHQCFKFVGGHLLDVIREA
ncbi:MAG: hypothetical protein E8D45_06255 [Nitrospira sp.]|nr:MAG: hypothetical protein E8D45_06255 [Nitrospira sp.]